MKAFNSQKNSVDAVISGFTNPEVLANSSPESINKAFNILTDKTMTQSKTPLSRDEAEVQVAISAGAPVPVFVKSLNNKLTSGNPEYLVSGAMQIQQIRDAGAGHALTGLSKEAEAIAFQFAHQRGSMPDSDLARKVTENIINIDSSMQKTLDNSWNIKLSNAGAGGLGGSKSLADFALSEVGLNKNKLGGAYFKTIYGNDIYSQLRSNFDTAKGDYDTAVKMTQNYVDQNYGETRMNGDIQLSDRPIEKVLGYTDPDVVPFIQQDLLSHLNTKFEEHKNDHDYWSIKPVTTDTSGPRSTFRKVFPPAEVIRHVKTDKGEKQYSYPLNLVGRPGNEWDVIVQTPSGPRNLFLVAPSLGVITYKPNAASIRKNFQEHINKKGWF